MSASSIPTILSALMEKTAQWSLSVGWFKLKILIKRGYTVETPLNSDS